MRGVYMHYHPSPIPTFTVKIVSKIHQHQYTSIEYRDKNIQVTSHKYRTLQMMHNRLVS